MELSTRLPEFNALDIEVAKNYDMVSDALFNHIDKRIDVVNILGDDLFTWAKKKLKEKRSWTVDMSPIVEGYPNAKKKTIAKFAEETLARNVYVVKSTKSTFGFIIEVNSFLNWWAGQWYIYGKNEADVIFQLRDYEKIKNSLEKLEGKFKVKIEYTGSEYEAQDSEYSKAIALMVDSTDALSKETILHYHDIFKDRVLVLLR